jgi:hypothetical protein
VAWWASDGRACISEWTTQAIRGGALPLERTERIIVDAKRTSPGMRRA